MPTTSNKNNRQVLCTCTSNKNHRQVPGIVTPNKNNGYIPGTSNKNYRFFDQKIIDENFIVKKVVFPYQTFPPPTYQLQGRFFCSPKNLSIYGSKNLKSCLSTKKREEQLFNKLTLYPHRRHRVHSNLNKRKHITFIFIKW